MKKKTKKKQKFKPRITKTERYQKPVIPHMINLMMMKEEKN